MTLIIDGMTLLVLFNMWLLIGVIAFHIAGLEAKDDATAIDVVIIFTIWPVTIILSWLEEYEQSNNEKS